MREQAYYLDEGMDFPTLEGAFSKLVNLEKLTMNTLNTLYQTDVYERIGPWDYALEFLSENITPWGVRQLNSLLLGAASSNMKLKKLRAGRLCWTWFSSPSSQKSQITRACESLTSLHLVLTCMGESAWPGKEALECYQFLSESGAIRKFLANIPHLESLKLKFVDANYFGDRNYPARISHLTEDGFVWSKLRKLELAGFKTSESRLIQFLERHASTLRILGLQGSVELGRGGSW